MTRILLVGCGNMGFALLKGWMASDNAPQVWVVEPAAALADRATGIGAQACADSEGLPGDLSPDLVILAVKPQAMAEVAPVYSRFAPSATFLSIAAGTQMATVSGLIGEAPLVRCMPNTPAAVGQGMMVCCANDAVDPQMQETITRLLSVCGDTAWIEDEGLMDAVTAISGSGPAYVFHFIETLASAGVALGLAPEIAARLALQTVRGAGVYAGESDNDPATLRQQVTSPGGTTAAALDVLMAEDGLAGLLAKATTAARDRGVALGRN